MRSKHRLYGFGPRRAWALHRLHSKGFAGVDRSVAEHLWIAWVWSA